MPLENARKMLLKATAENEKWMDPLGCASKAYQYQCSFSSLLIITGEKERH